MYNRRGGVWRWPVLSVGFLCVAATLSQYIGLRSVGFLDRVGVGLLEFGAMLAFAIFIWIRLGARKPVAAPEAQQQVRRQWRLGQGHMFETAAPPASHAPQQPAPSGSAFAPPTVAPANPLPPVPPIQHGPPPPRPQPKQPPPQAQPRPPAAPLWPPDPVERPMPPASKGESGWPDLWADDKRPPRL